MLKNNKTLNQIKHTINKAETYNQALCRFKSNYPINTISKYFTKVMSFQKIIPSKINNLVLKKEEELKSNALNCKPLDIWHELAWTALTLNKYSVILKDYTIAKNQFENMILLNNYGMASQILTEIEEKFGKSFWGIKNRLILLQETEGLESQKKYSKELQDLDITTKSKILIYLYSISVEKNISRTHFDRIINNFFEGFSNKGLSEYYKFKLKKDYQLDPNFFSKILIEESSSSIIDIYETFFDILSSVITSEIPKSENTSTFIKIFRKLYNSTQDERYINLLRVFNIFIKPTESEIQKSIFEIYDSSQNEKYSETEQKCTNILSIHPTYVSLYDVYVEALYLSNKPIPFDDDILIYKILNCYRNMLTANEDTNESIMTLFKILVTYSNLSFTNEILTFLYQYVRDENSYKSKIGHLSTTIFSLLKHEMYSDEIKNQFLENIFKSSENSQTVNILMYFDSSEKEFLDIINLSRITENNKNNFLSQYYFFKENFDLSYAYTKKLLETDSIFFQNIAMSLSVVLLLQKESYTESLNAIVEYYFKNNNLLTILPLIDVIEKITNDIDSKKKWPQEIEAPILFYLCTLTRNHDILSRTEYLYEYYLSSNDYKTPMDLIKDYEEKQILFNEKTIFFLKEVCIPDIMKKSIYLPKFNDVEKERVQVCHALSNIDSQNEKLYFQEIKDREQKIFIKKERSRIEKNKIYVDVKNIKKIYEKELEDDYERLINLIKANGYIKDEKIDKMIKGFKALSVEQNLLERETLNTIYFPELPDNEVDDLFKKIVDVSKDIFVNNEHYGLNVYLSTKIRHGTISTYLRNPLEKENLITLNDTKLSEYQENQYWEDELFKLDITSLKDLQKYLKSFSREHDNIIKYLSVEFLQVSTAIARTDIDGKLIENKNPNASFKYYFSDLELKDMLYRLLDNSMEFNEFNNYLVHNLWEKTDINLKYIRETIREDIKNRILNNFDLLQENLKSISGDLTLLTNAITKSRTDMNQAINNLITWFARMEDSDKNDFEIKSVIDIVKNIFNKQENVFSISIDSVDYFKGKTLDSFVDILFILFDNAFQHSGLNDSTKIEIKIEKIENFINIMIKNNIKTKENLATLNEKNMVHLNAYGTLEATANIGNEGNTGFNKIWKIITKDLSINEHTLDFKFIENSNNNIEFVVNLNINVEELIV